MLTGRELEDQELPVSISINPGTWEKTMKLNSKFKIEESKDFLLARPNYRAKFVTARTQAKNLTRLKKKGDRWQPGISRISINIWQ